MSDYVEVDGKRYYEESYLQTAKKAACRRQQFITECQQIIGTHDRLDVAITALLQRAEQAEERARLVQEAASDYILALRQIVYAAKPEVVAAARQRVDSLGSKWTAVQAEA